MDIVVRVEVADAKPKSKAEVEKVKNDIKGVIAGVVKVAINQNLVRALETSVTFENLQEQEIPEIEVFTGKQ